MDEPIDYRAPVVSQVPSDSRLSCRTVEKNKMSMFP